MSEEEKPEETNQELDKNVDSAEEQTETEKLEAKIKSLEEAVSKAKSDHLYLMAEFDNYRKRAIKERSDFAKYAGEHAFVEILGSLDNFERALMTEISPENIESFHQGFKMVFEELKNTLGKYGIQPVDCEGQQFDPAVQEALGMEEKDGVPAGQITQVVKKPYKMHDKLIRPGQVIVAK